MKVKFFVGDDSNLADLENQVADWTAQVTPINVTSSVHYDNGWHIVVVFYYQEGPLSNLAIPTMKFHRVD